MTRDHRAIPFATLLCLLLLAASNTTAAVISFVPSAAEVNCDATIDIDVVVDGVSDLRGFTLEVEFDPTLLEVVSVSPGADLTGAPCPSFFHVFPMTGTISAVGFDGAPLGCSLAGPASVATVRFKGLQDGISILDCRSAELRNSLNLSIPFTCTTGVVQVNCPVGSRSERWSTLKDLYR